MSVSYARPEHVKPPEYMTTGIPGFDNLFEIGIPRGTNILVAGSPGTGKTIFCLQALYNLTRAGQDCLFITFEELPMEMVQHANRFGWNFKIERVGELFKLAVSEVKKSGTFAIRSLDPFAMVDTLIPRTGRFHIEKGELTRLIPGGISPYLIALDSLSALAAAFGEERDKYRVYVDYLFKIFKEMGATTFWITETEEASTRYSTTGIEEFLADGVIVLYNSRIRDQRVRAIEILKLRGVKHESRVVPIDITDQGLVVRPTESIREWQLAHRVRLEEIR